MIFCVFFASSGIILTVKLVSFSPMIEFLKPTDRVGIVGVGGLGHLAIQFSSKMGCDVVVFSGTEAKHEDALMLGAREF